MSLQVSLVLLVILLASSLTSTIIHKFLTVTPHIPFKLNHVTQDLLVNRSHEFQPVQREVARIVLVHGMGEHCGRRGYREMSKIFAASGIRVVCADNRGHGQTALLAERGTGLGLALGTIPASLEPLVQDTEHWLASNLEEAPGPVFIMGHSLGGAIAARVATGNPNIAGLILSSAALVVDTDSLPPAPVVTLLEWFVAPFFPLLPIQSVNPTWLGKHPQVAEEYLADPLVYSGPVRASTGVALLKASEESSTVLDTLQKGTSFPVLAFHGFGDRLASTKALELVQEHLPRATTKWYDGYHELLQEPGLNEIVTKDILAWVEKVLSAKQAQRELSAVE